MNRVERITYYENLMKTAQEALEKYEAALEGFASAQSGIEELEKYLGSREWRRDFESCEKGNLPENLPCGVLSEDGIFNLLEKNKELKEESEKI